MRLDRDNKLPLDTLCYVYLEGGPHEEFRQEDLAKKGEMIIPHLINALKAKRREAHNMLVPVTHDIRAFEDELDWKARDVLEPGVQAAAGLVKRLVDRAWSNPFVGISRNERLNKCIAELFERDRETIWAASLVLGEAATTMLNDPKNKKWNIAKGLKLAFDYSNGALISSQFMDKYEATLHGIYLENASKFMGVEHLNDKQAKLAKEIGVDQEILEETVVTRAYGYFVRM